LSTSQPANESERQIRNARAAYFDNFASGDRVKLEDQDPNAPVPIILHEPGPKGELPADLSDIIVHGTIVNSQAFQSRNHEAVYTETTVRIERVDSLAQGQTDPGTNLVILKDGGALLLPNGRVVKQVVLGSGNELQLNGRYVFFLRYEPILRAYGCLKAWGLSGGKAVAVSSDDLARVETRTSFYNGMSESQFLGVVYALRAGRK